MLYLVSSNDRGKAHCNAFPIVLRSKSQQQAMASNKDLSLKPQVNGKNQLYVNSLTTLMLSVQPPKSTIKAPGKHSLAFLQIVTDFSKFKINLLFIFQKKRCKYIGVLEFGSHTETAE